MISYREEHNQKRYIMGIIARAAFFALCPECGRHGHIICADRTVSNEFVTITGGLKELTALMLADKIAQDESLEVTRQIRESGFDREAAEMDEIMERRSKAKGGVKSLFDELHRGIGVSAQVAERQSVIHAKRTLH